MHACTSIQHSAQAENKSYCKVFILTFTINKNVLGIVPNPSSVSFFHA